MIPPLAGGHFSACDDGAAHSWLGAPAPATRPRSGVPVSRPGVSRAICADWSSRGRLAALGDRPARRSVSSAPTSLLLSEAAASRRLSAPSKARSRSPAWRTALHACPRECGESPPGRIRRLVSSGLSPAVYLVGLV